MPQHHERKAWPVFFRAAESGEKTFEVRRKREGIEYCVGDTLELREYDPSMNVGERYTGRMALFVIRYVLDGDQYPQIGGLATRFCVLGIQKERRKID